MKFEANKEFMENLSLHYISNVTQECQCSLELGLPVAELVLIHMVLYGPNFSLRCS